ncbi:hypothetical protein O3P69_017977 [Scylla paramamosain]|uniref:Uncharacterized protein n=1 Tax=Scylla paramamosain TaxID=85552 RepID=A0AAW0TH01_SCYPA
MARVYGQDGGQHLHLHLFHPSAAYSPPTTDHNSLPTISPTPMFVTVPTQTSGRDTCCLGSPLPALTPYQSPTVTGQCPFASYTSFFSGREEGAVRSGSEPRPNPNLPNQSPSFLLNQPHPFPPNQPHSPPPNSAPTPLHPTQPPHLSTPTSLTSLHSNEPHSPPPYSALTPFHFTQPDSSRPTSHCRPPPPPSPPPTTTTTTTRPECSAAGSQVYLDFQQFKAEAV